jgi:hypothetical protein
MKNSGKLLSCYSIPIDRRSFLVGFTAAVSDTPLRGPSMVLALADQEPSVPRRRFPVALSSTRTAFVDQFGSPCFACGEDAAYLNEQLVKSDIEVYLSDRAARGFNVIWLIPVDKVYQNNPPNDAYGNAPFIGPDFTNFNGAYWNYVDHVMERCLAHGITILFMPLFVGLSDKGYLKSLRSSSNAVIQDYGTFLANRYKGFPNLIWLLGGDADPYDSAAYRKLDKLATALKAADPMHLMTMEATRYRERGTIAPNGGYSSVDAHLIAYGSVKSWLDFNWVYQTGPTVTSGSQRCYMQGLPCLLGEDWYELEHSETAQGLREEGYGAVLGGCTLGRLSGNQQIWSFNSPNAGVGTTDPSWRSQLGSPGSVGQQLLGKLFRSRSFHLLVPDISNVVMKVGSSSGSICARTSDGQTIIVYLPFSQTVTIDLSKITDVGSTTSCNWYNPSTGASAAIGNFVNSGERNFTSPDSNDWVLVIDSAAAQFRAPGS